MAIDYWQKFEEGIVYHIYNRSAFAGLNLFNDDKDYLFFLEKFEKYLGQYCEIYAYCLMPNHFHFLCKIKKLDEVRNKIKKENTVSGTKVLKGEVAINDFLVNQFKRLFSSFALSYNHKYDKRGSVFSEKFKRVSVDLDMKFEYQIAYIHHNPIHHRFRKKYEDWEYSSFHDYISDRNSNVSKKNALDLIGGLDEFIKIHQQFKLYKSEDLNFG